jgi:hypothetical protein
MIAVDVLVRALVEKIVGGGFIVVRVVIRVEEDVDVLLVAITSIAIIVVLQAVVSGDNFACMLISSLLTSFVLVGLVCFPKRVFAGFAHRRVDEVGRSTACVGLE